MAEIWKFPANGGGVGHFGNADEGIHGVCLMNDDKMDMCGATEDGGGGVRRKRHEVEEEEEANDVSTSHVNGSGLNDCDVKRPKTAGSRSQEEINDPKAGAEPSSGEPVDQKAQKPEPPKDYIHVRARRGQVTDSHSLAERARREKISERMKILQDLVPGCNNIMTRQLLEKIEFILLSFLSSLIKVIGKALVLDEIINYVQSLQSQVEFLSMKLEAVNSRMNPAFETFPHKDFGQQAFDANAIIFSSQAPREYSRGSSPEWLHMQVGGNFDRTN